MRFFSWKLAGRFRQAAGILALVFPAWVAGQVRGESPRPTREEIFDKLEEVFSRPEFSPVRSLNWLEKLLGWLADWFAGLAGLHQAAPLLFWVLLLGCLVLLALLLGHIFWTIRRALFASSPFSAEEKSGRSRQRLSKTYWEEACFRSSQGDFTEAIRFLFLSLVYRFDETERVNFQKSCTNREYLRLFADNPPVHEHLQVFVDTLDEHWYGQRPAEQPQYQNCLALYKKLV